MRNFTLQNDQFSYPNINAFVFLPKNLVCCLNSAIGAREQLVACAKVKKKCFYFLHCSKSTREIRLSLQHESLCLPQRIRCLCRMQEFYMWGHHRWSAGGQMNRIPPCTPVETSDMMIKTTSDQNQDFQEGSECMEFRFEISVEGLLSSFVYFLNCKIIFFLLIFFSSMF